jgi:hypothetical protein
MYLKLQSFLSRYGGNFENKHKNSSEKEKAANKGKIILNKQMFSKESN